MDFNQPKNTSHSFPSGFCHAKVKASDFSELVHLIDCLVSTSYMYIQRTYVGFKFIDWPRSTLPQRNFLGPRGPLRLPLMPVVPSRPQTFLFSLSSKLMQPLPQYTEHRTSNRINVIPCHTMLSCHTMLYRVIPCYTMLDHVIPCHTMLYHVIPCYTMLYHVIPLYTILYHVIPCQTMLFHVIPRHTMLYHAIPCYLFPRT